MSRRKSTTQSFSMFYSNLYGTLRITLKVCGLEKEFQRISTSKQHFPPIVPKHRHQTLCKIVKIYLNYTKINKRFKIIIIVTKNSIMWQG